MGIRQYLSVSVSRITDNSAVCWTVCSCHANIKVSIKTPIAGSCVKNPPRPTDSLHKGPVMRKAFPISWRRYVQENTQHTQISIMMTSPIGNSVCVTVPLCKKFTGHRLIPLTESSDAGCNRSSAHFQCKNQSVSMVSRCEFSMYWTKHNYRVNYSHHINDIHH